MERRMECLTRVVRLYVISRKKGPRHAWSACRALFTALSLQGQRVVPHSQSEIRDVTSAIHDLWVGSCSLLHLSLLSLSSSHALLGPLISHCS